MERRTFITLAIAAVADPMQVMPVDSLTARPGSLQKVQLTSETASLDFDGWLSGFRARLLLDGWPSELVDRELTGLTADPRVAGVLEVPGFSDHLVPLSDRWLLGVGKAADSTGRAAGVPRHYHAADRLESLLVGHDARVGFLPNMKAGGQDALAVALQRLAVRHWLRIVTIDPEVVVPAAGFAVRIPCAGGWRHDVALPPGTDMSQYTSRTGFDGFGAGGGGLAIAAGAGAGVAGAAGVAAGAAGAAACGAVAGAVAAGSVHRLWRQPPRLPRLR